MLNITIILSIIALISAILTIYSKLKGKEGWQFIFKSLTMVAIFLIAFLNSSSPLNFYQKAILLGLIFSTIGDVFLIKQDKYFVQGLVSFLLGHICYIVAFWTVPDLISGLFYTVYVIFFLTSLWKFLGKLKIPVIFYALTIAVMSWMALSRFLQINDSKTLLAFLGSFFFVVSDSFLGFNKFKKPFANAHTYILATYFLAQWLIALSV